MNFFRKKKRSKNDELLLGPEILLILHEILRGIDFKRYYFVPFSKLFLGIMKADNNELKNYCGLDLPITFTKILKIQFNEIYKFYCEDSIKQSQPHLIGLFGLRQMCIIKLVLFNALMINDLYADIMLLKSFTITNSSNDNANPLIKMILKLDDYIDEKIFQGYIMNTNNTLALKDFSFEKYYNKIIKIINEYDNNNDDSSDWNKISDNWKENCML